MNACPVSDWEIFNLANGWGLPAGVQQMGMWPFECHR